MPHALRAGVSIRTNQPVAVGNPCEVMSILLELNALEGELRGMQRANPLAEQLGKMMERRAALAARLPAVLATHYQRLVKRGAAPIAMVTGGHCSACQLKIPRQSEIAGRALGGFLLCPHCSRILLTDDPGRDPAG